MSLEQQADQMLTASGWFAPIANDPEQIRTIPSGLAVDMDAILNGPSWVSRLVARKMGV